MMSSKSQSIPIAPSRYRLLEQRYMQEERAAMIQADYDDFLLYQRIVGGIEKTQEATQCTKLRDLNQQLIDHLHYIRHASSSSRRTYTTGASPPSRISDSARPHQPSRWNFLPRDDCDEYAFEEDYQQDGSIECMPTQSDSFASVDDEETLIFELDL
ncbi:unnamed protein product [Cylindrotheca closterium]|uniref:Uncharacterized protein n=1 Tax=Cylindrotheca closterium TaxID=2856 RepID=A0AAD2GE18_9STRA|nr:unnamed protein product [Cylindrotheca closterium]